MKIKVEIKSGKEWVRRAMLRAMNKPYTAGLLSQKAWFLMLRNLHSPIEEYEIWIDATEIPERVHTHLVRHEEIGKYVGSSRPDLANCATGNLRSLSLKINAKRLIEICRQRLCADAWCETQYFLLFVIENLTDEILRKLCAPPCVCFGVCIGKRQCGYDSSTFYKKQREFFISGKNILQDK